MQWMWVLVVFTGVAGKLAASDTRYYISTKAHTSTGNFAPFWFHQQTRATLLPAPSSVTFEGGFRRDYGNAPAKLKLGYEADGVVQLARDTAAVFFNELYAKARYWWIEVKAGVQSLPRGVEHPTLSAGGLLFSRNTRSIPAITIGFDDYHAVPFTYELVSVKGGLMQGWFTQHYGFKNMMLHHKYMQVLLGKNLPVRLHARLDHAAQWGGTTQLPGYFSQPSDMKDFISIFLGRSGGDNATVADQSNVLGNHIIGQSLKLEADIGDWTMAAYWQIMLEDMPLRVMGFTMNYPDGLWGFTLTNRSKTSVVKSIVYEYLNTTDQSGPFHDMDGIVYGGADNYFEGYYPEGWAYAGNTIGTPLITSPFYKLSNELHTFNNRVRAHHIAIEGAWDRWDYKLLTTFTRNFGFENFQVPDPPVAKQRYYLLDVQYQPAFNHQLSLGAALGIDRGQLTGNSYGLQLSARYHFN
jgi:hypothetical protein